MRRAAEHRRRRKPPDRILDLARAHRQAGNPRSRRRARGHHVLHFAPRQRGIAGSETAKLQAVAHYLRVIPSQRHHTGWSIKRTQGQRELPRPGQCRL